MSDDFSVKIISFASGKGGVGKTLSVIHMAIAAARRGRRVLLIDGDLGMANVDILLGLSINYDFEAFFDGMEELGRCIVKGPYAIDILPSGSGIATIANLNLAKRLMFLDAIMEMVKDYDYVFIDTGAGIGNSVLQLNSCSDEIVVVSNPEPHALTDAYAFIKVMREAHQKKKFNIIINKAISDEHGLKIYNRFAEVIRSNLDVKTVCIGIIPYDEIVTHQISSGSFDFEGSRHSLSGYAWEQCFSTIDHRKSDEFDSSAGGNWDNLLSNVGNQLKVGL